MKNWFSKIITPHLELRLLIRKDAPQLQQLLEQNKEHMLPWIPWAKDEPQTIVQKEECIKEWIGNFYLDTKYVYGVFDNDKTLVGLGFLFTRQGSGILEIGYLIDFNYSGKGYATELTYALTKLSFELDTVEKVQIHCSPKNTGSARIPEKLNFKLEGTLKLIAKDSQNNREDSMIWGQFKEEFKTYKKFEPIRFIDDHII